MWFSDESKVGNNYTKIHLVLGAPFSLQHYRSLTSFWKLRERKEKLVIPTKATCSTLFAPWVISPYFLSYTLIFFLYQVKHFSYTVSRG